MGETYKTINVGKKLHKEYMLFKIKTNAKSIPEVMKKALKLLKKHEKGWRG